MKIARIFAVVAALTVAIVAGRAEASSSPERFIDNLAERALALVTDNGIGLAERRQKFDQLLAETFDMEGIGRFLLGRHWRLATPEDREAYLKAFTESTVYTYSNRFDDYSGQKLAVDGSREDGQFTLVASRIIDPKGGPDVRVDWRVIRQGDAFKVVDVVIEGVSMSVTQRQEYASVIQSNGGDVKALIKALNDRMDRLRASGS
jgi:phospholipid transport system substrate-binding protein